MQHRLLCPRIRVTISCLGSHLDFLRCSSASFPVTHKWLGLGKCGSALPGSQSRVSVGDPDPVVPAQRNERLLPPEAARQLSGSSRDPAHGRSWVDSCPQESIRFRGKVRWVTWIEIQRADVEFQGQPCKHLNGLRRETIVFLIRRAKRNTDRDDFSLRIKGSDEPRNSYFSTERCDQILYSVSPRFVHSKTGGSDPSHTAVPVSDHASTGRENLLTIS